MNGSLLPVGETPDVAEHLLEERRCQGSLTNSNTYFFPDAGVFHCNLVQLFLTFLAHHCQQNPISSDKIFSFKLEKLTLRS